MSAWMTSETHRNLIVKAHVERSPDPQEVNVNALAQALFVANRKSLFARYRDPMPKPDEVAAATYYDPAPGRKVSDEGASMLAACFDYQSCEYAEWQDSNVYQYVIKPLYDESLMPEPGDERLPWGAEEHNVEAFLS